MAVTTRVGAVPNLYDYTIGSHHFSLPWAYVGGKTQVDDSLLINADFPDFAGSYGKEDRDKDPAMWREHLSVIVEPPKEDNALKLRAQRRIKSDGLSRSSLERRQGGKLLVEIFSPPSGIPHRSRDDEVIIFSDSSGAVSSILICDYFTPAPYPGCQGDFVWEGLLVRIAFSKLYKEDWFSIESGTVALLQRLAT